MADFLKELQAVPTSTAPEGGKHNFYRGCHPSVYNKETTDDTEKLKDIIDYTKVKSIWQEALQSSWKEPSVWIHGDIAIGNLLMRDSRLTALLDFGCCAIGDPACDLVIA